MLPWYNRVPDDAEELCSTFFSEPISSLGAWKTKDGVILIAGYHCGPSGEPLIGIYPDGTVHYYLERFDEVAEAEILVPATVRRVSGEEARKPWLSMDGGTSR